MTEKTNATEALKTCQRCRIPFTPEEGKNGPCGSLCPRCAEFVADEPPMRVEPVAPIPPTNPFSTETLEAMVKAYAQLLTEHDKLQLEYQKVCLSQHEAWARLRDISGVVSEKMQPYVKRLDRLEKQLRDFHDIADERMSPELDSIKQRLFGLEGSITKLLEQEE